MSREPSPAELELLRAFVVRERTARADHPEAARLLTTPALAEAAGPVDGAALVALARALLNTDNFISRE